jgi:hypothetical protein
MNSHAWGYLFMMIGILGLFIINISTNLMMTNEQDYFILREVTEAAMIDSIDYRAYREGVGYDDVVHDNDPDSMYCLNGIKGQYRILKEKFVENFTYRFVNSVDMAKKYRIIVNEVVECPPKVTVTLLSSQGFDFIRMFTPTKVEEATLRNQITAILETSGEDDKENVVIAENNNCDDVICPDGYDKVGCDCVEPLCAEPRTCPEGYTLSGCDTCIKSVKATFHGEGGSVVGSSVLRCVIADNKESCTTKSVVPIAKKSNFNFIKWEGPQKISPGENLKLKENEDYYAVYEVKADVTVKATFDPGAGKLVGKSPISCNIKAGSGSCTTTDATPNWSYTSSDEGCTLQGWREVGKPNSALVKPGVKLTLDKDKAYGAVYTCDDNRKVYATFNANGGILKKGSTYIGCTIKAGKTCCKTSEGVPTVSGIDEYHIFSKWKGPQNVKAGDKLTLCNNETYDAIFTKKARPLPTCTIHLTNTLAIISADNIVAFGMGTSSTPNYNSTTSMSLQEGTIYGYVKNADGVEKTCKATLTKALKKWTVETKTCDVKVDKTTSTCTEYNYQIQYTKSCLGKVDCEPCTTSGGGCRSHAGACVGGPKCGNYSKNACENGGHGGMTDPKTGKGYSCGWDPNAGSCTGYYPTQKNCASCCNNWSGESSQEVSSCSAYSNEDAQVRCSEVKHRYNFSGSSTTTVSANKGKESDYCTADTTCNSNKKGQTYVNKCETKYSWASTKVQQEVPESTYDCPSNQNEFTCDTYAEDGEKFVGCSNLKYYCKKGTLYEGSNGAFCN